MKILNILRVFEWKSENIYLFLLHFVVYTDFVITPLHYWYCLCLINCCNYNNRVILSILLENILYWTLIWDGCISKELTVIKYLLSRYKINFVFEDFKFHSICFCIILILSIFVLGNGSPKGTLKDSQKNSSPYKNIAQYTPKQTFLDDSRRASSSVSQVRLY